MRTKDIVKITVNLVIVYLVGGLILAVVYVFTAPVIEQNQMKAQKQSLRRIMPEADTITNIGSWMTHDKDADIYVAKKAGVKIGYVIRSFGKGYSSLIDTLVAADTNFTVIRVEILGHSETPGLGDVIDTPWFKGQLAGKDLPHLKVTKKGESGLVNAISGATISSRAVTEDAVKNGVEQLMKSVKRGASNVHQ